MKIQKFITKDFFKIIFKKFFFENGNWIYFKDKVISAPLKLRLIFFKNDIFTGIFEFWRLTQGQIFKHHHFRMKMSNFELRMLHSVICFIESLHFNDIRLLNFKFSFCISNFFLFEFLNFHFLWKKSRIFDISSKIDITYKIYV